MSAVANKPPRIGASGNEAGVEVRLSSVMAWSLFCTCLVEVVRGAE